MQGFFLQQTANPARILLRKSNQSCNDLSAGNPINSARIVLRKSSQSGKDPFKKRSQSCKDPSDGNESIPQGFFYGRQLIPQKSFFGNATIPERILLTTDLRSCKDLKRSMCSILSRLSYKQNKNKMSDISNFLSPTM